jgi:hypothetical protein
MVQSGGMGYRDEGSSMLPMLEMGPHTISLQLPSPTMRCAGKHNTVECKTKTVVDASCAACKTKGHFAFWRKGCNNYEEFRRSREVTRAHLREATTQIHKATRELNSPSFSLPNQWITVEPKRVIGAKAKRPRRGNGDEERRGPGRATRLEEHPNILGVSARLIKHVNRWFAVVESNYIDYSCFAHHLFR